MGLLASPVYQSLPKFAVIWLGEETHIGTMLLLSQEWDVRSRKADHGESILLLKYNATPPRVTLGPLLYPVCLLNSEVYYNKL